MASQVYVGARDGVLSPEAAFDLACLLAEWGPSGPLVRELAERSAEGTDPEKIAGLARRVLALTTFQPGFDLEPVLLAGLEAALEAIKADMRATGLAGPVRLIITDWNSPPHAYAEFRGHSGNGSGIGPDNGSDPRWALVAVADDLQDAVMETLWEVWPLCSAHNLGAHARAHDGTAVWWCNASGGHIIAPIGKWYERARS